jgi:glyceraldehyde-3-phosphate dehydrogenase (NADP+)
MEINEEEERISMSIKDIVASVFPKESAIPPQFAIKPLTQKEYLVNGVVKEWGGQTQEILSPVCVQSAQGPVQKVIGTSPLCSEAEALEALSAATAAYDMGRGDWPTHSVEARIRHVEEFVLRMVEKRTEIINLIMWEIGKNLQDSEKEFDRTMQYIRDTVEALKELDRGSSRFSIKDEIIAQIRRAPLGVVLCMGPYNYPLNETYATLIPALIMGNTVVFKPPKYGVLLHAPLLEAFRDSFPPGVVNTIYGEGKTVIGPVMQSGKIDVLAFIGSSKVADLLKQQHPAPHRLRGVLGLGAKNVGIILANADLSLAVKECIQGTLSYNGQRCTALKLLFVHKKRAAEFLELFAAEIAKLKCGMPWEPDAMVTPLPEAGKTEYLSGLVAEAKQFGAAVVNEGGGLVNKTFFYPALLYPVNAKMRVFHEEQFGPVVPVAPFTSLAEPLNYIVESPFGQQLSIFGTDPDEISDLIDPLVNQVCRVNINSQCQRGPDAYPFTGRKDSAEGTLSVSDALRAFTIRTLVAAKGTPVNKEILSKIVRERKSNFLSTDFIF